MRNRLIDRMGGIAKSGVARAASLGSVTALTLSLLTPMVGGSAASAQTTPTLGPVDVARQAGVYRYMRSWSVNVADINRDGHPDMFVPEHDPESSQRGENIPSPHMFMGSSTGQFSDHAWPGPATDRHDCTWGDVNNDGRVDMFCAVGLTSSSVNELWMQNADGTFTNKAAAYGITANTHGRYRTSSIIDANNDGWPDIFVTRYSGANGDPGNPLPPEANPYPNELWINHLATGGGFTKDTSMGISTADSAGRFNNQCNQTVDYNGDGKQDLLLCTDSGVHLYRNDGTQFTDVAGTLGVGGSWNDAEMADLNNDGLPDLIEVRNDTLRVMKQTSTGTFKQVFSMPVTLGLNIAVGDFDGNGYKDIYVVGSCSSTGTGFPPDSPDNIVYNNYDGTSNIWNFSPQPIPAIMPKGGCGDDVAALDYNGDGLADFFVTNGRRQERGPTQLWTYGPDTAGPDTIPPDTTTPYPNIQRLSSVSSTGSVPVDVKWLGTDTSGISVFHLDKSSDGGQTFNEVYSGLGINQTFQLMPGTGPYEFRLNALDVAGNTSSWAYSRRVATELRQQDASNFTYSGSWATQPLSGASGGSVMTSARVGDTMTLVTPPGARWFGLVSNLGPDRGKANITFDGNAVGNIDLYSPTVQKRKVVWQRGLKTGTTHTVKLVLTGADPSSLGSRIDIDGLATFFNP